MGKVLKAIIELFTILYGSHANTRLHDQEVFDLVKNYIQTNTTPDQYPKYINLLKKAQKKYFLHQTGIEKKIALSAVKIARICHELNQSLNLYEKITVVTHLFNFIRILETKLNIQRSTIENEFIDSIGSYFEIDMNIYNEILIFIFSTCLKDIKNSDFTHAKVLNLNSTNTIETASYEKYTFEGELVFLYIKKYRICLFQQIGLSDNVFFDGNCISKSDKHIFLFNPLSTIKIIDKNYNEVFIYLDDIIRNVSTYPHILFTVEDVSLTIKKKTIVNNTSFIARDGELIAIMGSSGSGKTTLVNILNNNIEPTKGSIYINGTKLYKDDIKKYMGYVDQGELLIEELSIYDNLYFSSKLSLPNISSIKRKKLITQILSNMGLLEYARLRVGSILDKVISGGQRKRLNIAIELIREPSILFLDEPTSGLSSKDALNMMLSVRKIADKNKLIFVVIHQPSAEIYKLFDKVLILDTGGFPIYFGTPSRSLNYFKTIDNQENIDPLCNKCGNVVVDEIFEIIEKKKVTIRKRKVITKRFFPAKQLNEIFANKIGNSITKRVKDIRKQQKYNARLPHSRYEKPNRIKQFLVFINRDIKKKSRNINYLLINLLVSPILVTILAVLFRYYDITRGTYIYSDNDNIPQYIFISVLVTFFIGIMGSTEEIIKDSGILKREFFLSLNWSSYLMAKITLLSIFGVINVSSYILIGNSILHVKDMFLEYFIILFLTYITGSIIGLCISAVLKSVKIAYILVPLIVIPQILFSGILINYHKMNPWIDPYPEKVPIVANIITTRWAYEALAVINFTNNKYGKLFFDIDKKIKNNRWKMSVWLPAVSQIAKENIDLAKHQLSQELLDKSTQMYIDQDIHKTIQYLKNKYRKNIKTFKKIKKREIEKLSPEKYMLLKNDYKNKSLEYTLTKNINFDLVDVLNNEVIAHTEQVYRSYFTDKKNIFSIFDAHYYTPRKICMDTWYSTPVVNCVFMLVQIIILSMLLLVYCKRYKKI